MGFADEFEEMRRIINRMVKDALEGRLGVFREPFVYGFTSRSRDGRIESPRSQVQAMEGPEIVSRDPISDVILTDDALYVTADLPGVSEDDVDVRVEGRKLVIEADGERRYFAAIDLPRDVDPSGVSTTLRNGVLDVTIKRNRAVTVS